MSSFRKQAVAVALILNDARNQFLLLHNHRWKEYALPMKKVAEMTPAETAISAVTDRDFPGNLEGSSAFAIAQVGQWHESPTANEPTRYQYHVFEITLANPVGETPHPDLRWFSYEELQDANNVTKSTKSVLKEIVEHRTIAAAIVTRQRGGVIELMLIDNPSYGLFPPASRIKDRCGADYWALQALRDDIGFDGSAVPTRTATVEPKENTQSGRYPAGAWRQYELVWYDIEPNQIDVDVTWYPIDDLRNLPGASPHLDEIRLHLQ